MYDYVVLLLTKDDRIVLQDGRWSVQSTVFLNPYIVPGTVLSELEILSNLILITIL